jgi:hypothetical protein
MTTEERYLELLTTFESQVRGQADSSGHIGGAPEVQKLLKAWDSIAASYRHHPDATIPIPFWLRPANGKEPVRTWQPS